MVYIITHSLDKYLFLSDGWQSLAPAQALPAMEPREGSLTWAGWEEGLVSMLVSTQESTSTLVSVLALALEQAEAMEELEDLLEEMLVDLLGAMEEDSVAVLEVSHQARTA